MQPGRNYETVGSSLESTPWNPQMTEKNGMVMSQNPNDNIREGYYVQKVEMPGNPEFGGKPYHINVIQTLNPDGTLGASFGVIGDTVLQERLDTIQMKSWIMVKYLGRAHKKGTPQGTPFYKTNSYHMWEIGIDRNAIPYDKMAGATVTPAVNNQNQGNGQNNQQGNNFQGGQNNQQGQNFQQNNGQGQNNQRQGNNFQQNNNQQHGQGTFRPTTNPGQQGQNNQQQGQNFQQGQNNGQNNQQGNNMQQGNNQGNNFNNDDLPF